MYEKITKKKLIIAPLVIGVWVKSWSKNWPHCITICVRFSWGLWESVANTVLTSLALGKSCPFSALLRGALTPAADVNRIIKRENIRGGWVAQFPTYRPRIWEELSFAKRCQICPIYLAINCCRIRRPSCIFAIDSWWFSGTYQLWRC